MTHLRFPLFGFLLCVSLVAVAQEPGTLDLETVAALATRDAPSLVGLRRTLDNAADELGWGAYRDDLSLSLSGSLDGDDLAALTRKGSATLEAGVEVLPQLTITGKLIGQLEEPEPARPPEELSGSVGLTVRPLADSHGRERDRIAYDRALLALESEARGLAFTAVTRLLDAVTARTDLEIAEADAEVAERSLASTEALAERDRATDTEVEAARDTVRAARQTRERRALAAERARWSFASAIGLEPEAFALPHWEELALEASVADIRDAGRPLEPGELASATQAVRAAELDVRSAQVELAATHRFTPELSAGASVNLPGPSYSLSLGLTVSPADWDGSAKDEAEEDVRLAERDAEATRTGDTYDARAALLDLEIAIEEVEAELIDLALAEQAVAEARFRFDRGDVTALALAQSELALGKAQVAVNAARASVVRQWYSIDLGQY